MDQSSHLKGTPSTFPSMAGGEPVEHGGRLRDAMRKFPKAPAPFIDLSTGINPIPYPVPDIPAKVYSRLPEPEELQSLYLAAALAYRAGDPSAIAAAPGTQALIDLLPRLIPAGSVSILSPTYAEHARAWTRAGHDVTQVDDFEDLQRARIAVLCNPNNPDGRRIEPARLVDLATHLASQDGWLIVDEAFAEFDEQSASAAPMLPQERLLVLRSFGKAYGLPGLRLGFVLAPQNIAAAIREELGPWPVSGPALAVGTMALADTGWRTETAQRLQADRARMDGILSQAGFDIVGGTSLFRLASGAHAGEIWRRLCEAGILVRSFKDRPGWLRFGLPGSEEEWQRLQGVLSNRE